MKLLLIKPKVKHNVYMLDFYVHRLFRSRSRYIVPPLSLAIVASLTPKDVEISIIDENIEEIDFNQKPDLVGVTITSFTAPRGYEIADTFRAKGIPVVLGGVQAILMPKESLKHADSIVVGEAENNWSGLVEDFKNGSLKRVYKAKSRPDLTRSPIPRWDLLRNKDYTIATLQLTRGCPHCCEFCVAEKHFGKKIRKRPIKEVIREINLLKDKYKFFWFVDDNLFFDRDYVKEFIKELIPLGINYYCFANTYIAEDDELLGLLAKSGCLSVNIGFETINPKNLQLVNKAGVNEIEDYPNIIKKIQSYGIRVRPQFILGFNYDDLSEFKRIEEFINKNNLVLPDVHVAGVFYGTKHYHRLKKEKRISPSDYTSEECKKYGYALWDTKLIGHKEFMLEFALFYQRLYSYKAVFNRLKNFFFTNSSKNISLLKDKSVKKERFRLNFGDIILKLQRACLAFEMLLSEIEWKNTFMQPFFFEEYLNYKIKKEYSKHFLLNDFNKKTWQSFKKDINKFIKEKKYNHLKNINNDADNAVKRERQKTI